MAILLSRFVQKCKAIGSERRVMILRLLGAKPRNVNEIARALRVTHPAAFFHLRKLERENYIVALPHGKYTYYALSKAMRSSSVFAQITRLSHLSQVNNV